MKIKEVLKKIESFQGYFGEEFLTPAYERAWQLNKKHGLYLSHLPRESAEYIEKLVINNRLHTIVEVGTSMGYSTLHLSRGARHHGGHVYTIEKSAPRAEFARVHFREAMVDNITLLEGKAEEILKDWEKKIDLLFLDGDKKNYLTNLKAVEHLLSPGAFVVADNVSNFEHEVQSFLEYIKQNPRYTSKILPLENGLLVAKIK